MKTSFRALAVATAFLALPALGAWEELRRNDQVRLSIDPKTIKRVRPDTMAVRYLVDFRQAQGDVKTGVIYRSLATKVHIRCKARTIVVLETEAYPGNEAKGPSLGVQKPRKGDDGFKKLEPGTSDEDLHKRVCETAPARTDSAPARK